MKAAIGRGYGKINEQVFVVDDHPRPSFDKRTKEGRALIRVQACALAPGDVRVLSGLTACVQGPPSFPYVIGGDVCGIVEEVCDSETRLKVGQCVISQFELPAPRGGCAEYYEVATKGTIEKPDFLDVCEASGLGSSGTTAMILANMVKRKSRVLVLGGSGGVGSLLVQLLKAHCDAYVAATSTQIELLTSLGVDRPIDYTTTDVWNMPEFQKDPFDTVIDLVDNSWDEAKNSKILKNGWSEGRFITIIPPQGHIIKVNSFGDKLAFVAPIFGRVAWTFFNRWLPRYVMASGVVPDIKLFEQIFAYIKEGKVRVVLDPVSPLPFTTEGVRRGLEVQASYHAHGKVVIKVGS